MEKLCTVGLQAYVTIDDSRLKSQLTCSRRTEISRNDPRACGVVALIRTETPDEAWTDWQTERQTSWRTSQGRWTFSVSPG